MWVSVMLTIAGMSGAPAAPAGAAERPAAAAAESDRDAALRRVDAWIRATELRLAALHEGRNRIEAGETPAAVLRELFERGAAEGSDDEGRPERGSYPDRRGDGRGRPLDPRGEERRGERRPELSEEELAEERAFVEERLPRLGERLREIEAKNPEAARRMLNRLSPRLREIRSLTETDPDLAERRLEQMQSAMRLAELGHTLRNRANEDLSSAEQEALRAELRSLLAAHFDERVREQEIEVERLREQVAELEASLREQRSRREETIAEKVDAIMARATQGGAPDPDGGKRGQDGADREN